MGKKGDESSMGGFPAPSGGKMWPDSPWSLIQKARVGSAQDKKATLDRILLLYYKPVYRFFQRALGIRDERLKDVTQDFFTRFVEKDFLKNVTHEKSFRNFLKVACRRHYINWCEAERARRPHGERRIHSLHDAEGVAIDVPMPEERTSSMLDEELRAEYLQEAVRRVKDRLLSEGKEVYFHVFEARVRFDEGKPTEYTTLASRFNLSVFDVRNYLSSARKVFREALVDLAAEGSDHPKDELAELGLQRFL